MPASRCRSLLPHLVVGEPAAQGLDLSGTLHAASRC